MPGTPVSPLGDSVLRELKTTVLKKNIEYLCEELGDPGRYIPFMRSKGVMDEKDGEEIRAKTTSAEKAEVFVTKLIKWRKESKSQDSSFDVFIAALKKHKIQAHVARVLMKSYSKLKSEREANIDAPPISMATAAAPANTPHSSPSFGAGQLPNASPNSTTHPIQASADSRQESCESDTTPTPTPYPFDPQHGPLPPNSPPASSFLTNDSSHATPQYHPVHGLLPPSPPHNTLTPFPETAGMHMDASLMSTQHWVNSVNSQQTVHSSPPAPSPPPPPPLTSPHHPPPQQMPYPFFPSSFSTGMPATGCTPIYESLDQQDLSSSRFQRQHSLQQMQQMQQQVLRNRYEVLEKENQQLKSKLAVLNRTVSEKTTKIMDLQSELESRNADIEGLASELKTKDEEKHKTLSQSEAMRKQLQLENSCLTEELNRLREEMNRMKKLAHYSPQAPRPRNLPISHSHAGSNGVRSNTSSSILSASASANLFSINPLYASGGFRDSQPSSLTHLSPNVRVGRSASAQMMGAGNMASRRSASQDNIFNGGDRRSFNSSNGSVGSFSHGTSPASSGTSPASISGASPASCLRGVTHLPTPATPQESFV